MLLNQRKHGLGLFFLFFPVIFLYSCASSPMIQPRINSLVAAERFDLALSNLASQQSAYGPRNELLYHLDFGLVLHYAGRYHESILAFERAKRIYDRLYTISLSNYASTWLVNDNRAPYRGEDFERALVNVFQALNFSALGQWEDSLVEARDVDARLRLVNRQYPPEARNVYKEDAFVRLLMGLVYESSGTREGLNDAFISYGKAWDIYSSDYREHYNLEAPDVLKRQWAGVARRLGWEDRLPGEISPFLKKRDGRLEEGMARVVVVHYRGMSPVKHQVSIPVPLPNGNIARLAFPKFTERIYSEKDLWVMVRDDRGAETKALTELAQDINQIAKENLRNRQVRVIAKAVLRQAGKQVAIDSIERVARQERGNTAGFVAKVAGNFYAYFSEHPDLRSWQTLPAEIRLVVLDVVPGTYDVLGDDVEIKKGLTLRAGQTEFLTWRYSK